MRLTEDKEKIRKEICGKKNFLETYKKGQSAFRIVLIGASRGRHDTQNNDSQHNDPERNNKKHDTQHDGTRYCSAEF
jgi:hypothetical protein